MARFAALRPYLEEGILLARAAGASARSDDGTRRTHPELVALVEGMALKPPRLFSSTLRTCSCMLPAPTTWPSWSRET